jgi:hypothetical protein
MKFWSDWSFGGRLLFVVAVIIIIAVIVLAATGQFSTSESLNSVLGVHSFKQLFITDGQHNEAHVIPGDQLELSYVTNSGRNGSVRWEYQIQDANQPWEMIVDSTTENPFKWMIPQTIFGKIRFRISSVENLNVSLTTHPIDITPVVSYRGIGNLSEYHIAVIGSTVKWNYNVHGSWLERGGIGIQLASDSDNFTNYSEIIRDGVTIDIMKKQVCWEIKPEDVVGGLYRIRLTTLHLKELGYPDELVYDMQHIVGFESSATVDNLGSLGTVIVSHIDDNGRYKGFSPGETLTLSLQGASGGNIDWLYNVQSMSERWSYIRKNLADTSTYEWMIPEQMNGSLKIRAITAGEEPDTDDDAKFSETTINVGVFLILEGDSVQKKPVINYHGSKNHLVSTIEVFVVGEVPNDRLQEPSNWTVGWYSNPDANDASAQVSSAAPPSVIHVDVLSGGTLPPNVSICTLKYRDIGAKLITENETMMSLYVGLSQFNGSQKLTSQVKYISSAKYKLVAG